PKNMHGGYPFFVTIYDDLKDKPEFREIILCTFDRSVFKINNLLKFHTFTRLSSIVEFYKNNISIHTWREYIKDSYFLTMHYKQEKKMKKDKTYNLTKEQES